MVKGLLRRLAAASGAGVTGSERGGVAPDAGSVCAMAGTIIAIDSGNVYTGASSGNTNRDTGGSVFSVPYAYEKQSAVEAKATVLKCAGPQPIR